MMGQELIHDLSYSKDVMKSKQTGKEPEGHICRTGWYMASPLLIGLAEKQSRRGKSNYLHQFLLDAYFLSTYRLKTLRVSFVVTRQYSALC